MKGKLVSSTLNEYTEIGPEGMKANWAPEINEIIEVINRSKGENLGINDVRNLIDYFIEIDADPNASRSLLGYLFQVHPELQDNIEGSELGELIQGFDSMLKDREEFAKRFNKRGGIDRNTGVDPRLN